MKCQQVQQQLLEYSEQLLDEHTRSRVAEHLQTCTGCTRELHNLEKTMTLLQSLPAQEPPEAFWTDFTARVMGKIKTMPAPTRAERLWVAPRFRIALAFCVLLLILGGLYVYFHQEIHQFFRPQDLIAERSRQPLPSPGVPQTDQSLTTPLKRIASEDLQRDMLEHDFALNEGSTPMSVDSDASDEMIELFINSLTDEEKEALLTELHKMNDQRSDP
jgi:hypothetical protein